MPLKCQKLWRISQKYSDYSWKKSIICLYEDPDSEPDNIYYYLDEIEMPKNEELIKKVKIYPLDYEAYITYPNAVLWDDEDKEVTADQMTNWIKHEQLYFSSNWLKANMTLWLRNNNSYGV